MHTAHLTALIIPYHTFSHVQPPDTYRETENRLVKYVHKLLILIMLIKNQNSSLSSVNVSNIISFSMSMELNLSILCMHGGQIDSIISVSCTI